MTRRIAIVLFLLGALARAAFVVPEWNEPPVDDAFNYEQQARGLLAGEGIHFRHFRAMWMPAYILFLAGHFAVFGATTAAVQVTQVLVGGTVGLLLYWITFQAWGDRRRALATGVAGALFPPYALFAPVLLTENLFIPLLLLSLGLWLRADRTGRLADVVATAAALGLMLLVRSQGAGLVGVFGLWAVLLTRGAWRDRLARAAAIGLTVSVMLSPWIVRNWIVLDAFVPLTTISGNQFGASNGGWFPDGLYYETGYGEIMYERHVERGEVAQSKALEAEGWAYVRAHPASFARWYGLRMAVFWDVIPIDYFWPYKSRTLYRRIVVHAVFLLGLAGAILRRRDRATAAILAAIAGYTIPFGLFANNTHRMRTPIDGLILILAVAAAVAIWDRLCGYRGRSAS